MLAAMQDDLYAGIVVRDPRAALQVLRRQWHGAPERWVFGYASLIWRPEFDAAEHRSALVRGWHRALRMRSRVNHGTPQQPGLVFALLPGGACRGIVYRLRPQNAEEELDRLWARETHRRLRRATAACAHAAGRGAGAGLHAQPPQRGLPAADRKSVV